MTVKELIIELLNCPMDAKILIEIPTKKVLSIPLVKI